MISVKDLVLDLGGRRVLDGISFDVAEGEAVALSGPNGSGKTSVLRCLLGLVPFEGGATIGGHDCVKDPIAARALTAYVPQRAAFGDQLAVEVLTFAARLRRVPLTRIPEVLRDVGLADHARAPARTFSGGMQQRLSLALALLVDAPVLLLDEPTASLDREGQRQFVDLVQELLSRKRTILLASHRSEEVSRLTDRVLLLEAGRVVEDERRLLARGAA